MARSRLPTVVLTGVLAFAAFSPRIFATPGNFVAVGDGGTILTSIDSATWTAQTSGTAVRLRAAAAVPGLIVVVGQSGTVLTSSTGATWTPQTSGTTETLRGIAASSSRFVAVGGDTASVILYSDTGTSWSAATVSNHGRLRAVAWGSGQFVAVGPAGAVLTSPDGATWTLQSAGTTDELDGVLWNGTNFIILSATGKVLTSSDGVSWSSTQANPPSWIEGLAWNSTQIVTVGATGKIKTSADGTSWSWQTSGTTNTLHGAAWTGAFVAQSLDPVVTTNNLRKLFVTGVTAANKVYDRAVTAVINLVSAALSGVNSGDVVNLDASSASATFADKNVGTGKTVTTSGFAITGTNASDYTLVQPSPTANITAKGLTIAGATVSDKTYDGLATTPVNSSGATLIGVVSGDDVSLSSALAAGAYADKTVGSNRNVTMSGFAITGGDASNYSLTQPTATASITAATLTVTGITANAKNYDGTTAATLSGTAALGGLISGDDVTLDTVNVSAVFADRHAGNPKVVSVSGFSISGGDAGNYQLVQPTGLTASIATKTLTASGITASDKTYDATTTATVSGTAVLQSPETAGSGTTDDGKPYAGDDVSLAGTASGTFSTPVVGGARSVLIGGLSLTGAQATDYTLGTVSATATIAKKSLTVSGLTASNKTYDGTTTATLTGTAALGSAETAGTGTTSDGMPYAGDLISLGGTAAGTFASKDIANAITVAVSGLTLGGAQSSNYSVTPPAGLTANISAKTITVAGVTANDKAYDGTTAATLNTGSATLVGVVGTDVVTLSATGATAAFANASVGTGKTVTISGLALSGTDHGDYTLTQPSATAAINAAAATVTLSNLSQTYDGSRKTVGVTVTPTVSSLTTYNGSTTTPLHAGSYSVVVTITDPNYSGGTSDTLTIAPASQTVSFSLDGTGTIGAKLSLNASASSGLPVAYSVVSGSAAIVGSTLSITGPGSVTVRASQAGNGDYLYASTDATVSNIPKLDQTISFGSLADKRANDAPFILSATASSGLPVTFTVVSGPAMLGGDSVAPSGAPGVVTIRASQAGNAIYNAAPDVTQTFTVVGVSPWIYFGSIGGSDMAAQIEPDGKSGTMIGTLPGTGEGFVVNFTPDANGDFVVTVTTFGGTGTAAVSGKIAPDSAGKPTPQILAQSDSTAPAANAATLSTSNSRTFRGHVSGNTVSGSVDGVASANFTAGLVPATGPTAAIAGYYQSSSLDTATGSIYSIVGTTSQVYALAVTPNYVGGNLGTANNNGTFSVQATGQTTITGAVDAPTTTVTGTVTQPNRPVENFSGLAVTTVRTDHLINLSSRSQVGSGDNVLIAGFVISGPDAKTVLLRGVGPSLAAFGIPGGLAKPRLQLFDTSGKLLLTNSGWGGDPTLGATFSRVGAFALNPTSADTAMTASLAPGGYTMVVSNGGNDAGGIALAEIYDASVNSSADYQRLVNISTRGTVGAGSGVLIGGFVVTGNSPKKLLVRGVGPGLTTFGVAGAIADPQLQIFNDHAIVLAQNDNWETPQALSGAQTPATAADLIAAANATGAFGLKSGSKDAALIVTLAPGSYTAEVSGVAGASGTALVEIYEVPAN